MVSDENDILVPHKTRYCYCSKSGRLVYALSNRTAQCSLLNFMVSKSYTGKGLFLVKNELKSMEAFTDADWAGSVEDRRSISG